MNLRGNSIGTDDDDDDDDETTMDDDDGRQHTLNLFFLQAERGFATSQLCVVTDKDGTILAHNILHGFDWNIEKGGNAPRAPDEMRDFYPPQAS